MTWWQDILMVLGGLAAVGCFCIAAWAHWSRPKWDGCIYKPPGFHGYRGGQNANQKRNRPHRK